MDNDAHYLPQNVADEVLQHATSFTQHFAWLARESLERRVRNWLMVPKHHYLLHLAAQCRWHSPRASWCYMDEDFVGKIAKVGQASLPGLGTQRVATAVCARTLMALSVRCKRRLLALEGR
jgi:hypothetical protein